MDFKLKYRVRNSETVLNTNSSNSDVELSIDKGEKWYFVSVTAKRDLLLDSALLYDVFNLEQSDSFFMNGYQSWTDSREMTLAEKPTERDSNRIPRILKDMFAFDRYGDSVFYRYSPDYVHGYDVFYVKGKRNFFSFNRNFKTAFAIYEVNKKSGLLRIRSDIKGLTLKAGESVTVFDLYLGDNYNKGLEEFRSFFNSGKKEKITGYTSWYNHYQNINEAIILNALDHMDERFNLFQIDDGYETFVGDWLDTDTSKFPNGLKGIVSRIHEMGMKAGIWLAPFVAETKSRVYTEHYDWILKDRAGKPCRCGSNWSGFYALDLRKEEVRDYLKKCFDHLLSLGFDFFKLDFLYASMIEEIEGCTRAQMAENSYSFLRSLVGDKIILGCGASCFAAFGLFDYMRIGPDISLEFDDVWYMRFMHRERVSTKTTLQNTIYRSIFDSSLFGNDPDVVLLRDKNIKLTAKQREALIMINSLFGSVFMTSDDIGEYDKNKKELLSRCLDVFQNAEDRSFEKKGKTINVSFVCHGKKESFTYHIQKGILL